MFDSLGKNFFYGIWHAINRKFAIISEHCRTDYDSLVLNHETFLERFRNVSRKAFRNAFGTRSGTRPERVQERVRNAFKNASGTRSQRVRNAFFIRLLLSSICMYAMLWNPEKALQNCLHVHITNTYYPFPKPERPS